MSNYKNLSNTVGLRADITPSWCWKKNIFTDEELDKIDELFSKKELSLASISNGVSEENKETFGTDTNFRRSNVSFHRPTDENYWIFQRINRAIEETNNLYYNYDLNGYDYLQYTQYDEAYKGHYDYHIDMSFDAKSDDAQPRKLSIVLMLNTPKTDFEGGDFNIKIGGDNDITIPFERGFMVLFPSFLLHKVQPVTKGIRKTLVAWVLGPKFK